MRGLVLQRDAVPGRDLIGFEDGSVGFETALTFNNGRKLPWDFLLLPATELNEKNEIHLIKKIGPFQAGEVRLSLQRVQVDGYEVIVGYDPGEELFAYVDKSLQKC